MAGSRRMARAMAMRLALAPAEGEALFGDGRVVPLWECGDEVVGAGLFRGGDDGLFVGAEAAVGDVGADGAAEDDGFLGDHPDL